MVSTKVLLESCYEEVSTKVLLVSCYEEVCPIHRGICHSTHTQIYSLWLAKHRCTGAWPLQPNMDSSLGDLWSKNLVTMIKSLRAELKAPLSPIVSLLCMQSCLYIGWEHSHVNYCLLPLLYSELWETNANQRSFYTKTTLIVTNVPTSFYGYFFGVLLIISNQSEQESSHSSSILGRKRKRKLFTVMFVPWYS